ncbi:MAG: sugar-binding transcriptional regulator [Anaerolineales bacterium]|nr:sugar-binding transcriptional regulator [Anaerolineales bacterium]MCB8959293.1 sugar-binding transcriptional regulator [Ardenticatenales bacterium]
MEQNQDQLVKALQAAQMYYYQDLPMKKIAVELGVSHSTVSRLLAWARSNGLVEIRIHDLRSRSSPLEELIKLHFRLREVRVVPVSELAGEEMWQERVARAAAAYLNQLMEPNMILGVAWGNTVNQIAAHLTPKALLDAHVVQLNGGGSIPTLGNYSSGDIITQFANNFDAQAHLLPAPAFFEFAETRQAMWRERSVRRILEMQEQADIFLFSVGSFADNSSSAVYRSDYLSEKDYAEMRQQGVVGDIANVMLRADGNFSDLPINERACGPDLALFHQVDRAVCVLSGPQKLSGLRAALAGGYLTDLIIDEPTARKLVQLFSAA